MTDDNKLEDIAIRFINDDEVTDKEIDLLLNMRAGDLGQLSREIGADMSKLFEKLTNHDGLTAKQAETMSEISEGMQSLGDFIVDNKEDVLRVLEFLEENDEEAIQHLINEYNINKGIEDTDEAIALDFKGYPKKSLFHTTLISRDLPLIMQRSDDDEQLNLFHIDVPVRRRDPDKKITGKITIDEIIEKHNNITFFDMFHYLGICRLYNNGDTNFTPDMVVRAAYSDSKKRVTDKQRSKAIESIDKFMRTVINIDMTEEYELYKKAKGKRVVLSENMIYAKAVKLKHSNGIVSAGYRLLEQPVLDVHAFNLSQIDYLDSDVVEISGGEADALLYTYLNSRLASAKNHKNKMNNIILLETIYKYMDLESPNRKKRAQIKSKIESRLNEWENKKVIKGSKFHKDKGKFRSVEIIV